MTRSKMMGWSRERGRRKICYQTHSGSYAAHINHSQRETSCKDAQLYSLRYRRVSAGNLDPFALLLEIVRNLNTSISSDGHHPIDLLPMGTVVKKTRNARYHLPKERVVSPGLARRRIEAWNKLLSCFHVTNIDDAVRKARWNNVACQTTSFARPKR